MVMCRSCLVIHYTDFFLFWILSGHGWILMIQYVFRQVMCIFWQVMCIFWQVMCILWQVILFMCSYALISVAAKENEDT